MIRLLASASAGAPMELFNGRDLTGWSIQGGGQFSVADGMIRVNRGHGWLRSDAVFANFTLVVEFRFLERGNNGGIYVRTGAESQDDEKGYPRHSYQVQCMDTMTGSRALGVLIPSGVPPVQSQTDYDALRKAYRPALEWNRFEITCAGDSLRVVLNGIEITRAQGLANLSGHVGIQGELGLLEFRKISILVSDP